jgi:uncharacterized membrane-anchored protein
MSRYSAVLWIVVVVALGWINIEIVRKERLINGGEPVFLQLAPLDPRSLIQGDYMVLRYAITDNLDEEQLPRTGKLVVRRDDRSVASFVRLHDQRQQLASDEFLLNFHQTDSRIFIGAESFFFQEGQAAVFEAAEYAELRVDETGQSVLVGLRDANLRQLQPAVQ